MPDKHLKITFEPQPLKLGGEWQLVAAFPNGLTVNITGFKTEDEAKQWLGSPRRMEWVRAHGYSDD
jgi:hypothetical protein